MICFDILIGSLRSVSACYGLLTDLADSENKRAVKKLKRAEGFAKSFPEIAQNELLFRFLLKHFVCLCQAVIVSLVLIPDCLL